MNDRKKDGSATQSTEFRVGTNREIVVQIKDYLHVYTAYENYNFHLI